MINSDMRKVLTMIESKSEMILSWFNELIDETHQKLDHIQKMRADWERQEKELSDKLQSLERAREIAQVSLGISVDEPDSNLVEPEEKDHFTGLTLEECMVKILNESTKSGLTTGDFIFLMLAGGKIFPPSRPPYSTIAKTARLKPNVFNVRKVNGKNYISLKNTEGPSN